LSDASELAADCAQAIELQLADVAGPLVLSTITPAWRLTVFGLGGVSFQPAPTGFAFCSRGGDAAFFMCESVIGKAPIIVNLGYGFAYGAAALQIPPSRSRIFSKAEPRG
jgi:hypothetical protein